VSPAKTAELIEMLFRLRTWVGSRNHVLDEDPDPSWEGAILTGEWQPHCKVQRSSAVSYAKTAEAIDAISD